MVVVEASGDEVVEGDAALLDKIVSNVVSPTNIGARDGSKFGEGAPQPSLEEVVTGAGDGDSPVVVAAVEVGGSTGARQDDGNLGEPSGLVVFADEVGESLGIAAVEVSLLLIVGGKINETRC